MAFPGQRRPRTRTTGPGPDERGPGVRLGLLGGSPHPHPYLDRDTDLGPGAVGERDLAEVSRHRGQRPSRRRDEERVVVGQGDHRLDALRLAGQEPMHRQAQLITRVPGQGAPGPLPQPRYLHDHHRELGRLKPVVPAEQDSVPDRHPDALVSRLDVDHRDRCPGQPSADRLQAGQRDRRLANPPEPFVKGREGRSAARILAQPHAVPGDIQFGVGLLHRAARQHVHADPLDVMALDPGPQQRGVQGPAVEPHVGGGHRDHPGAARVLVRHRAGEQADVDRGAEPGDLFGGFPLTPVGGGDQPPRQCAADDSAQLLAWPGRRARTRRASQSSPGRRAPGHPARRRAPPPPAGVAPKPGPHRMPRPARPHRRA